MSKVLLIESKVTNEIKTRAENFNRRDPLCYKLEDLLSVLISPDFKLDLSLNYNISFSLKDSQKEAGIVLSCSVKAVEPNPLNDQLSLFNDFDIPHSDEVGKPVEMTITTPTGDMIHTNSKKLEEAAQEVKNYNSKLKSKRINKLSRVKV